jgi:hypothetical protein
MTFIFGFVIIRFIENKYLVALKYLTMLCYIVLANKNIKALRYVLSASENSQQDFSMSYSDIYSKVIDFDKYKNILIEIANSSVQIDM